MCAFLVLIINIPFIPLIKSFIHLHSVYQFILNTFFDIKIFKANE